MELLKLHGNGSYSYDSGIQLTDEQESIYCKVEHLIDTAKEYLTAYENAQSFEIEGISDYRKLAEFGGVVFGAKDMGKHGFQFSSWFLTYGGNGATMGNYSFDYEASKENFAFRSGLVPRSKLFSAEEAENLYRCIDFTKENCESIDCTQERQLEKLLCKLGEGYPQLAETQPTFDEDESPQMNI